MKKWLVIILSLVALTAIDAPIRANDSKPKLKKPKITISGQLRNDTLVIHYLEHRNDPRAMDDEYRKSIRIVVAKPNLTTGTLQLPDSNITVSGSFFSVWVWDKFYKTENTSGEIEVISYHEKRRKLKLIIQLFETMQEQEGPVRHEILDIQPTLRLNK